MAWIASYTNDTSDQKVTPTLNGPALFNSGSFYAQYGPAGGLTVTGTTEISLISGVIASTATTNPVNNAWTVNMSGDPTGKYPASSLYLPGFGSSSIQMAPMGAFTAGTIIRGQFWSKLTTGGTYLPKLVLRNATTGAVAYTLTDTTTHTPGATNLGAELVFTLAVTPSNQITCFFKHEYGTAAYISPVKQTTIDPNQNYVLDALVTMGTSGTQVVYFSQFELVG